MATKAELYAEAQTLDIEGRSNMDKEELEAAIEAAQAADPVVEPTVEEPVDVVDEPADVVDEVERDAPLPVAPVISQEPLTGGLSFVTDRAQ